MQTATLGQKLSTRAMKIPVRRKQQNAAAKAGNRSRKPPESEHQLIIKDA
jgi:hypothetical protein